MVQVDSLLSLDFGVKTYAFLTLLRTITLVGQQVIWPDLAKLWFPVLITKAVLTTFIIALICVPRLSSHSRRLAFANLQCLFGVILYTSWVTFAIYNDWWTNAIAVMCTDDEDALAEETGKSKFTECYKKTQFYNTTDLIVNFCIGACLTYVLKRWADEKKATGFGETTGPAESDATFFGCMSVDTGVKVIGVIQCLGVFKILVIMITSAALRPEMTPFLFIYVSVASVFVLGLAVRDNNTYVGRGAVFSVFLCGVVLVSRPLNLYFVVADRNLGTSYPKTMCKDSSDPDCELTQQSKLLIYAILGFGFDIYFSYVIYKWWQAKKPRNEEHIALTSIEPARD